MPKTNLFCKIYSTMTAPYETCHIFVVARVSCKNIMLRAWNVSECSDILRECRNETLA